MVNSSADMPATFAYVFSSLPPLTVAVSILDMKRCIELPAASAFWPVAVAAVAHASIWCGIMPTTLPMPMKRVVMVVMSDSNAGSLSPRRTSASPNLPYSSVVRPMTEPILPRPAAISSISMFVATVRFATDSPYAPSLSTVMPSWPPIDSISSIWSALVTCVFEKSMASFLRFSKSPSVPFTVLRMSRYAESMSSAAWIAYRPAIMIAGVMVEYAP